MVLENGSLTPEFLPTSYCDTSFILDFVSFPLDLIFNHPENSPHKKPNDFEKFERLLKKYWKSESRILKMKEIVSKVYHYDTKTSLVYSPLVTMEFTEKVVEDSFKGYVAKYLSVNSIQRSGRKEIGKALKKIHDDFKPDEISDFSNLSDLELLGLNLFETNLGLEDKALNIFEVTPVDIKSFNMFHDTEDFKKLVHLSKLQIGVADILHLSIAQKLGCVNFLTFDNDFVRVKDEISDYFGLKVLYDINEIENTI